MANIQKNVIAILAFLICLNGVLFLLFHIHFWTSSSVFKHAVVPDGGTNTYFTNFKMFNTTRDTNTAFETRQLTVNNNTATPDKARSDKKSTIQNYNPIGKINLNDFPFVVSPGNICNDPNTFLFTFVTTIHDHVEKRATIRSTWASVKQVDDKKIETVFILGKSYNAGETRKILREFHTFQDIILADFDEHYLNLTLKTMIGMKWVKTFCPHVRYVLKTDDDVFVNYLSLVRELAWQPTNGLAIGYLNRNASVERNTTQKWYTPKDIYPHSTYPSYLQGQGYVLSNDVVSNVYNVSSQMQYINWEDVYVGLCLERLSVKLSHEERFEDYTRWNNRQSDGLPCSLHNIFTLHGVDVNALKKQWQRLLEEKERAQCRKSSVKSATSRLR
ncbi:beta-1,3-galactosyltransferase 5-like [Glandiceps talaboti]